MFPIHVTRKDDKYRGTTSEDRFQLDRMNGHSIYNQAEHARICTKVEQYGFYMVVDNNGYQL